MDRSRLGRCYELAGRRVLQGEGTLVHGTITNGATARIGHAWVIMEDGSVWEPISDQAMPMLVFVAFFHPEPILSYPREEALSLMARTAHFGPWHEDT